jgi:protein involved in polysaccharide export with SLBB domain
MVDRQDHTFRSFGFRSFCGKAVHLLVVGGTIALFCGFLFLQQGSCQTPDVDSGAPVRIDAQPEVDQPMTSEQVDSAQDSPATQAAASGGQGQKVMSADQIIGILKEAPGMLDAVKGAAAQRSGADPSTITDQQIYDQLQQNSNLRMQATEILNDSGYSTNPEAPSARSGRAANVRTPTAQTPTAQTPTTQAPTTQTENPAKVPSEPYRELDAPRARNLRSPYGNLPSLQDLYTQLPSEPDRLTRFGSDLFRLGTGNANDLPMDLPVGPDYVLGPGDELTVNLWGGHTARLIQTVDRQGQIALPDVGTITISGLSVADAQAAIQKALGTQFQGEHVEISPTRIHSVRVYVVGDVQRPGAYDISALSTPLNALFAAGGPTSRGSLRTLKQYRGDKLIADIDLYDLLLHGVRSAVPRLLPGDTILVPPIGPQVTISGMVRRPAIYELRGGESLNNALDLAGGVLVSANLKQIDVQRIEAHQSRMMLSVQLPNNPNDAALKLSAFQMQDGDTVRVSPILPYNEQTVYIEGHVYRPGKYPYHDGMTINDLLHSYQDVLPEPADHGEIVRLEAPDFRPKTIDFSLSDVLLGNNPIPLNSFDVIRLFGRYEVDPPNVTIRGDVLRPGQYPLSQGMTIAKLVRMAGGFRRSAYRQVADLTSYVVQDDKKVETTHSVVELEKALAGDSSADVTLRPGDVLGIRQMTGWQDIGASITVQGEVKFAGTYGINEGERLSSILKRAGEFREDAYPAGAILERIQVRELGEKSRQEMIRRLETTSINMQPGSMQAQEQLSLQQSLQQQQQQILNQLRTHPASGRLVVNISRDISKWENTPMDIEIRAGDTLLIPKRPNFVIVMGQVYNPTAITYLPGKELKWYLKQAGGVARSGNGKELFVVRANGSVAGHSGIWSGRDIMNLRMHPGDSVVVPEKIYGGSTALRNILAMAQVMSSVSIAGAAAGAF